MVLYYSATGNTEYIAKEIARQLDDECVDLLDRIKNQDFTGNRNVYFIFTSDGYCGISGQLAKWMFRKKKMKYMGRAEFKMPRNYVANDHYPMLEKEEVEERIINSHKMLAPTVETIKAGGKLKARHIFLFETIITVPFNPVWSKLKLRAKDFHCGDNCIGCGKCVKLCPLNNIELKDKKPVWSDHCSHCMACIGNCPVRAIEYGEISQTKEQYNFGKYRYVADKLKDEE